MLLLGFLAIGLALTSERLAKLISVQDTLTVPSEQILLAISALGFLIGFGLLGWVARALVRTMADQMEQQAQRLEIEVQAIKLLECRIAPALDRLAKAGEHAEFESPHSTRSHRDEEKAHRQSTLLEAIRANDWQQAEALAFSFASDHPEDPEATGWLQKVAEAKQARSETLLARLESARQVGDPEQVLLIRDELIAILNRENRQSLDRETVGWLMSLIHKRLRAGTFGPDIALLAGRIAEHFAETTEGASLRAALPTLRRSAGLCPRCVEPYTGVAEACPRCLGHDSSHDQEHWPEIPGDPSRVTSQQDQQPNDEED